ncbi:hypothetical protein BFJ63_vAg6424 [Fusarium oxysporum f. sp. narcissi]|nr:hypothetical protein BFJ65_g12010 [Fusarium oxysporum f. sp. cepae]RYC90807.1 hypothetical protein BFJ63_vAg6424 [Fusarium oxysporum f. sp. narcissi]
MLTTYSASYMAQGNSVPRMQHFPVPACYSISHNAMASISAYQHTIPEVESERKNDHGDSYNKVNWTTATVRAVDCRYGAVSDTVSSLFQRRQIIAPTDLKNQVNAF